MKIAHATLESLAPYSQSRMHSEPKLDKESHSDYEARTWRSRMHATANGNVFIPPMAFKFGLETAARFLRLRIPGKGQSEYGKHFQAGVIVPEGLVLPIKRADVQGEWLNLHANGKRGSGTRVSRCMPMIPEWRGVVVYYVLDDTIPKDIFEQVLRESGNFIGIGRFRPQNGGYLGRYKVVEVKWDGE
uniref:Uncharacterized protein n=1 Tax=viral metagenome TaxID=1070528 RepID=A0A6M3KVK6_9ZZZZ